MENSLIGQAMKYGDRNAVLASYLGTRGEKNGRQRPLADPHCIHPRAVRVAEVDALDVERAQGTLAWDV